MLHDSIELVFGFDFSNGKFPLIKGKHLSEDALEYVKNFMVFSRPFSNNMSEDPCYLGIALVKFDYGDNIFRIMKEYNKILYANKQKYEKQINEMLQEVIDNIIKDDTHLSAKDYSSLIDYFEELKKLAPDNISVSGIP